MGLFNKYRHFSWVLLLIPVYLFLFVKLGAFHLRLWDEGWFAVHAYEMLEKGSWFIPFYDGQPVHFGTKPPLQTWFQMLFISALGYDELSLRLPSAIAAAATVFLVFFWSKRLAGEAAAWIAALMLLTIDGFVHFHAARGAEADALLTLTILGQAWFFWSWTQSKSLRHLIGFALLIAISFWVKGVAGFMMLPGFGLYALLYDRPLLFASLRSPKTWFIVLGGIGLGLSYLLFREWAQPGYLGFVMDKQAGRFFNDVGHDQPFQYYYRRMTDERLTQWFPLVMLGLLWPFLSKDENARHFRFLGIVSLAYYLVICTSRSKLEWYAMPLYPMFAMLAAFPLARMVALLATKWKQALAVTMIFFFPLVRMFDKTQLNAIDTWSKYYEMEEEYLFRALNRNMNLEGLNVIHDHFDGALLFYKYRFRERGQHINLQNNTDLVPGERAMTNSDKIKGKILAEYEVDTIDQLENVVVYEIIRVLPEAEETVETGELDGL